MLYRSRPLYTSASDVSERSARLSAQHNIARNVKNQKQVTLPVLKPMSTQRSGLKPPLPPPPASQKHLIKKSQDNPSHKEQKEVPLPQRLPAKPPLPACHIISSIEPQDKLSDHTVSSKKKQVQLTHLKPLPIPPPPACHKLCSTSTVSTEKKEMPALTSAQRSCIKQPPKPSCHKLYSIKESQYLSRQVSTVSSQKKEGLLPMSLQKLHIKPPPPRPPLPAHQKVHSAKVPRYNLSQQISTESSEKKQASVSLPTTPPRPGIKPCAPPKPPPPCHAVSLKKQPLPMSTRSRKNPPPRPPPPEACHRIKESHDNLSQIQIAER